MENEENIQQPILIHAEPVLPVYDVIETIKYWQDVLGFPVKWTWGDPPTHGAVSWQNVFVQFSQDTERASASKGNSVWIRVQRITSLYSFHQKKNVEIVAPLENQPWGMAQYTIREINGYYLHFAGMISEKDKSDTKLRESISIIERLPTIKEYRELASVVGWSPSDDDTVIEKILSAAIFAVVAINTRTYETIGAALLLGDNVSFYYVKDVMVRPDWQGKRVGSMIMNALTNWLEKNASNNALVALVTGEALESFYQQFGFAQAFSMIRFMHRNENNK